MKKIKRADFENIAKYIFYFLLILISVNATTISGLKPLGLGVFAALIYAGKNIILLMPMYLLSNLISNFSWQSAVIGTVPAIIFISAYFVHHKINKKMNLTMVNIYTLVSQIPSLVFGILKGEYIAAAFNALLTQIFAYIAIIAFYTISIRGLKFKLTFDEILSLLVTSSGMALALYDIGYQNFRLFYLFYGFIIMFSVYNFPISHSLFLFIFIGIGCALSVGSLDIIAVCILLGCSAISFKNCKPVFAGIALILTTAILGYYFEMYSGYGYVNLISVFIGILIFLTLPVKYKNISVGESFFGSNKTGKTIVSENRRETSLKLYSLATVFEEMQNLLQCETGVLPDSVLNHRRVAKDIALSYCGKCENCANCFSSLGNDTSIMLESAVESCIKKGKASIIDMPPFITSRCKKINGLLQQINEKTNELKKQDLENQSVDRGRQMLAVQMGGIAEILDNLADDYKRPVSFDGLRERRIIEELTYNNIDCKDCMVYGADGDINVSVVVNEDDADKQALVSAISRVMKVNLVKTDEVFSSNHYVSIQLAPAPRYDIVYGEAFSIKNGENVSGDSRFVKRIYGNKMIVALSDGMGSGENANSTGNRAGLMVENFYQAGFSNDVVITLSNRLLSVKKDENFSALDLSAIDLQTGACDFIKLGAAYSIIKHDENIEILECSSLPVGIVDNVNPTVTRRILVSGDIILLFSDGITDNISKGELCQFLSDYRGNNPETLAEDILNLCKNKKTDDDMTVMAVRIFSKL